jgi:hypothetical protein
MKDFLASIFVISVLFIVGCQSIPKDALSLSPEALAERQLQTRKYETQDEAKVLAACAGLLQDLGFNLDESETPLGLITASKDRSAVNAGEQVAAVLVAVFLGVYTPTDKDQRMRACVVSRPLGEQGEYVAVRVTFQRVVRNTQGQITICESLTDPKIYQEFFDKLSKSIFLEAQGV